MRPHIHAGVVTGLAAFAMVIIAGALWRTVAYQMIARNDGSPLGEAMLYVY